MCAPRGGQRTFTAPAIIITSDAITACTSPVWRVSSHAAAMAVPPQLALRQLAADGSTRSTVSPSMAIDTGQQHEQRSQISSTFSAFDRKRCRDAAHGHCTFAAPGQAGTYRQTQWRVEMETRLATTTPWWQSTSGLRSSLRSRTAAVQNATRGGAQQPDQPVSGRCTAGSRTWSAATGRSATMGCMTNYGHQQRVGMFCDTGAC